MERSLYRHLIGTRWSDLAGSVRSFLCTTEPGRFRGRARIWRSPTRIAGLAARLLILPQPSDSVSAKLVIIPEQGFEIWSRTFGNRSLTTKQSAGRDGILKERYGPLEFSFALRVDDGALHFDQLEATIHLAGFCMRIPRLVSPRVSAVCEGRVGLNRTHASVQVSVPLIGTVVAYDGDFESQG